MCGSRIAWATALCGLVLCGCGDSTPPTTTATSPAAVDAPTTATSPAAEANSQAEPTQPKRRPVQLGGASTAEAGAAAQEASAESVLSAMQPLQVFLGKWNGTSRKAQIDQPEWIWDFQTNRAQPSLLVRSEKSAYIREGRLTFLPDLKQYQFSWQTPEGTQRVLRGDFVQPVQDVPGDNDKKLQRTFKLKLTEGAGDANEQWQVAFHQQENNRYILEIDRRRGSGAFQRVDTIHTQRDGTSFALSDTDYGEKTCIISQGLGTSTVSYKGQSYWVCCSGCQAAFNADPERWIAKWEEKKKSMKQ